MSSTPDLTSESDVPDAPDTPVEPTPTAVPEPDTLPETRAILEGEQLPAGAATAVPGTREPIPHVEHRYQPEAFACVRCGSRNLAKGMIVDYGDRFEQVRFAPKRLTLAWLNSLFNLRPWRSLARLDAVACRDCGAVLLTVDPEVLRHAERTREE